MREAQILRKTTETEIKVELNIDGTGDYNIKTGCGFLNHMLELFARHGRFNLSITCSGDTQVDFHHTVEDTGIALARAFSEALTDRAGIQRYGSTILPMDEALILTAIDISGRPFLGFNLSVPSQRIGGFDTELVKEFFTAFCNNLGASLHINQLAGENSHHIVEGTFKSFARSLSAAVKIDEQYENEIPSTKGTIL